MSAVITPPTKPTPPTPPVMKPAGSSAAPGKAAPPPAKETVKDTAADTAAPPSSVIAPYRPSSDSEAVYSSSPDNSQSAVPTAKTGTVTPAANPYNNSANKASGWGGSVIVICCLLAFFAALLLYLWNKRRNRSINLKASNSEDLASLILDSSEPQAPAAAPYAQARRQPQPAQAEDRPAAPPRVKPVPSTQPSDKAKSGGFEVRV